MNVENQTPNNAPASDNAPELAAIDPDLALLESYLDGELTSGELSTLQQRLRADNELSGALSRLSTDYTTRQAVWSSLEGSNVSAEKMARVVVKSIHRASFVQRAASYLRWGSAVAACLVCFTAGWIGRGSNATASVPGGPPAASESQLVYQVALTDDQGNITAVQKFDTAEDAQAFAADLGKWQARQNQLQNGQAVLTSSGL